MEVLGHSQIAITMNLYAHVLPATRKEAAARMDDIFAPPPKTADRKPFGTVQ